MKKRPIPISTLEVPPDRLMPANWDLSGMVGMMSFFVPFWGPGRGVVWRIFTDPIRTTDRRLEIPAVKCCPGCGWDGWDWFRGGAVGGGIRKDY